MQVSFRRRAMFQDKTLKCRDCSADFTFTAGEQEFFASKRLSNEPKKCQTCRMAVRMLKAGKDTQTMSRVNCADCGAMTVVPFVPTGVAPVHCNQCMRSEKNEHKLKKGGIYSDKPLIT